MKFRQDNIKFVVRDHHLPLSSLGKLYGPQDCRDELVQAPPIDPHAEDVAEMQEPPAIVPPLSDAGVAKPNLVQHLWGWAAKPVKDGVNRAIDAVISRTVFHFI